MPPPDDTDLDVFGHNHGVGGTEVGGSDGHETFDDDFDGFGNLQHPPELLPGEAAGTGTGRGRGIGAGREGRPRGWQSRAANAIRNLRPGRRPAPPGTQHSVTTPGSRTFLIYVIGGLYFLLALSIRYGIKFCLFLMLAGYYPPDHSIVTGGPNNLDSFEALLYVFSIHAPFNFYTYINLLNLTIE
jgi:hypothetical protein